MLTGIAIGCPAAAVLLVNKVRDRKADRRAGRRTLAGRLEPANARRLDVFGLNAGHESISTVG